MKPPATISIDLDDLWAYRRSFGLPPNSDTLLPLALPRFLQFMAEHGLHGTAFIVGHDATLPQQAPALRALAAAGHEVGNHSFSHAGDIEAWSAEAQHADLARAHAAITDATGVAPQGFRGPSFRVSARLLHTVQALGYRYDSTTFPNALAGLARRWQRRQAQQLGTHIAQAADAFGAAGTLRLPLAPYAWALPQGTLVEVPVTTLPGLRVPLHGTYLQHLADTSPTLARCYASAAMALCRRTGLAPHLLLHGTDFIGCDDALDTRFLPGMQRPWRDKLALLVHLVQQQCQRFDVMPMGRYVAQLPALRQMDVGLLQ